MNEQRIIMNRLLDKYEHSKHLTEPGVSNRRVMLKVEKKDLPEYAYEDAAVRDSYNEAAKALEKQHLVQLEWVKGRPVLSVIVLCLDRVMQCYALTERQHPRMRANRFVDAVSTGLDHVTVPWITAWKDAVCQSAGEQMKVPAFCKDDDTMLADLLCAFRDYSALSGDITMRAFSSRCYSDTKYFERNIRDIFLKIAKFYPAFLLFSSAAGRIRRRLNRHPRFNRPTCLAINAHRAIPPCVCGLRSAQDGPSRE